MSKKACLECLRGIHNSGNIELDEQLAWMKHYKAFTYADTICDPCVKHMGSTEGDFTGAPMESFKHFTFLLRHFDWLYAKVRREMPDTPEAHTDYNMICKKKNEFITMTMRNIHKDPEKMVEKVNAMVKNVHEHVTRKEYVIEQRSLYTFTRSS